MGMVRRRRHKLFSRWSIPFKLVKIYPHGDADLPNEQIGNEFNVNGQRVKTYLDGPMDNTRITVDPNNWEGISEVNL